MQPPRDVVNAVLSFLYTLLAYRIDAIIVMEGLDPYVGYLHTLDYGKRALCFDLMEEYRTSICDTLTCALFNLGIVKLTDFQRKVFNQEDDEYPVEEDLERDNKTIETSEKVEGVLLTREGLQKAAYQFEEKLKTLILYPPLGKQLSYEQVMIEQVRHFKRVIFGEETEFKTFVIK
jgi:CRISPR-associated protein Cas1